MSRILLEADGIEVRFGDRNLLKIDHLRVYESDRIGLIGENGAGKSTLLKVLAGELAPDAGTVRRACPVALIRQTGDAGDDISKGLRSAFRAPVQREGLSGGELTRRRIAAALTLDAPLLLADEPTTDLDGEGIAALRETLARRRGAMILVSHDRALLRSLCDRIWRLEDGKIDDFPGGYDACQAELQRRREYQQFKYDRSRAEQARLKAAAQRQAEWAASVKKAPKRMGNSEARLHTREYTNAVLALSHAKRTLENRMERLERVERPRDLPEVRMALGASRPIAAKIALRLERASLSAGGRALLSNAALTLPTGSRTALIGENGCGKTTLMRAIAGECPPGVAFSGKLSINPGARIGRFDQDHAKSLDLHRTALENAMADTALPESEVRTVLARLGLRGDDVFKTADWLSGGERARVALAKLLVGSDNLLILDEPTNHLDLYALEALEQLLAGYAGTLLLVSHDRAFVEAVATRIARFEDRRLVAFEGTIRQMEAEAGRDLDREHRQLEITALEMRLAALAARMAQPKKGDRPEALSEEYDQLAEKLRQLKRA